MKGRIGVQSELGTGTTFTVFLPLEAKVLEGRPISTSTTDQQLTKLPSSSDALIIDVPEEANEATNGVLPELLIIEDNQDIITYIKTVLDGQYGFHTARNGAVGIEKALEVIPDIIISDVMMPEKDGYEVCATLKQDERTSHIPVILLTAKSTQQDKIQGLKYGADAYLTKPFDKEELMVRLERLVTIRQQLQKRYTDSGSTETAEPSLEDVFLQKLHDYIQAHLSKAEFGVPQLTEAAHLSQMQLYRKLKALTGKTPSQFIRSYRLQQGLLLLKKGKLTVSEVAYEVGFTDPSYFSRTFQQEFKRNPRSFLNS